MRAYVSTYLHKFKYGIYSYGGYGGCSQSSQDIYGSYYVSTYMSMVFTYLDVNYVSIVIRWLQY